MKTFIKDFNGLYCLCIGLVCFMIHCIYKMSAINKLFFALILVGKLKLLYDFSKYLNMSLLDLIRLSKPIHVDLAIVYLIYKNRDNSEKLKQLFETSPELKLLFTKPIKKFLRN